MGSFGFKGKLYRLKLDSSRFLKEHERRANQVVREAAREFVLAAYMSVPVWTGMARGAFKYSQGRSGPSSGIFLSVYLKVLIPIGPTRTHDGGPLAIRANKSPQDGGAQSRYTFSGSNGQFRFTFNTSISHFQFNDITPGKPPSFTRPWGAFKAGSEAFNRYLKVNAKSTIPKLSSFLTTEEIIVG